MENRDTTSIDSFADRATIQRLWNSRDENGTIFCQLIDDIIIATQTQQMARSGTNNTNLLCFPATGLEAPPNSTGFSVRKGVDSILLPTNVSTAFTTQESMDSHCQSDLSLWEDACKILGLALPSHVTVSERGINLPTTTQGPNLSTLVNNTEPDPSTLQVHANGDEPASSTTTEQSNQTKQQQQLTKNPTQCQSSEPTSSKGSTKRKKRRVPVQQYFCTTCNKAFKLKRNYDIHIQSHLDNKLFACQICGKNYHDKSNLQRHFRTNIHISKEQRLNRLNTLLRTANAS